MFTIPQCCIICNAHCSAGLCPDCAVELVPNAPCCPCCAQPAPLPEPCAACRRTPSPIAASRVPFRYTFPVDALIRQFKFEGRFQLAVPLGRLLARAIDTRQPLPEVLIPVPLHRRRLLQRGYNQALELAAVAAAELGIALDYKTCIRTLPTVAQTGLDHRQRRRNLRGAFRATRDLPYHHIAILDDVITTGTTVAELARLARRTGTPRIEAWALARAVLHNRAAASRA